MGIRVIGVKKKVKELLDALLLPRELTVINVEAYAKPPNRKAEGDALADYYTRQANSSKVMILSNP